MCLLEWETGIIDHKDMQVKICEEIYEAISRGMEISEQDDYGGPLLEHMYQVWWDDIL